LLAALKPHEDPFRRLGMGDVSSFALLPSG